MRQYGHGQAMPENRVIDFFDKFYLYLAEWSNAMDTVALEADIVQEESLFSRQEWQSLSQMVELFKPFNDFTKALSSDTASLSLIILLI